MDEIKLGAKVADKVTGFTGTVTVYATYLHGNDRVCVSTLDHEGKKLLEEWFDVARLASAG
jgi:hypothetical protein